MRRSSALLLVVVIAATVSLPASVLAQQDPPVVVRVVCGGGDNPPTASANPDPYVRTLQQPGRWILNINRPGRNTIAIEPKPEQPWPYTGESYSSDANGMLTIPPDQFTGETGTFYYQVAYTCDGQAYILDPRMDVGRGGGD